MHIRNDPSFFSINKTGAPQGAVHQVPNQFETPLVESEEDPASPQEILRESLELLVHSQVTSSPGDANNLLGTHNDRLASLAFSKGADLFIHTFLELHYWTLTLEVSQTSTLITGVSSLIPSSSRIPTILGHVVNLLCNSVLHNVLLKVHREQNVYEVSFKGEITNTSVIQQLGCLSRMLDPWQDSMFIFLSRPTFSGGGDDEGSVATSR
ncbi:hypothetical protein Tco_1440672 [Tanacetum coccineum]